MRDWSPKSKVRWLAAAIGIACLVAALALLFGPIPGLEHSYDHSKVTKAGKHSFESSLPLLLLKLAKTLNDFNGAITALATAAIAVLTWRLIVVGRQQHNAAMGALDLARDEFNATHRPKLIVRDIHYTVDHLNCRVINYSIVNVGDAKGRIIETSDELIIVAEGQYAKNIASQPIESEWNRTILGPGAQVTGSIRADLAIQMMMLPGDVTGLTGGVHFLGNIVYEDGAGRRRRTRFQRKHVRDEDVFTELGNPNYEYAD